MQGRCRAGEGQVQGRCKAGAGQVQGRCRAGGVEVQGRCRAGAANHVELSPSLHSPVEEELKGRHEPPEELPGPWGPT